MPNGNGQQPNDSSNQGNNGIPTGQQPTGNPSGGQQLMEMAFLIIVMKKILKI